MLDQIGLKLVDPVGMKFVGSIDDRNLFADESFRFNFDDDEPKRSKLIFGRFGRANLNLLCEVQGLLLSNPNLRDPSKFG